MAVGIMPMNFGAASLLALETLGRQSPRRSAPQASLRATNMWLFGRHHTGHLRDQPIVQFFGRVVAGTLELGLESSHLDQSRQVATGPDRNDDVRDVPPQDPDELFFHPEPVAT